jgi:hypothetical protein
MPDVYTLVRQPFTDDGTLGEMFNPDGSHLCFTMELPWDDNIADESCIPDATYTCVPHNSDEHPGTWEVQNVPNRSGILIHNGNTDRDSLGCIIVGKEQGKLNGLPAVLMSNVTLQMLQQTLPDTFTLTISWASPLDELRQA